MSAICPFETTEGDKPKNMVNSSEGGIWIDDHPNPQLPQCGTLPICARCNLLAMFEVGLMAERVADRISQE